MTIVDVKNMIIKKMVYVNALPNLTLIQTLTEKKNTVMSLSLPPRSILVTWPVFPNTGSGSCQRECLAEFSYARHWHTTRDNVASSCNHQFITQGWWIIEQRPCSYLCTRGSGFQPKINGLRVETKEDRILFICTLCFNWTCFKMQAEV